MFKKSTKENKQKPGLKLEQKLKRGLQNNVQKPAIW